MKSLRMDIIIGRQTSRHLRMDLQKTEKEEFHF
jgi:hypothetical protein